MLRIESLNTFYGRVSVLKTVELEVRQGEIVALLGANGAGKTTLLNAVSGLVSISSGRILYRGQDLARMQAHDRVAAGIAHCPEGRQVFKSLSVEDNLVLGAYRRKKGVLMGALANVYEHFPVLRDMRRRTAADLSGGQQQMLAIGRALMSEPDFMLLDEPSLGLAPLLIEQIFEILGKLRERGVTILVVEQNAAAALKIADRGYVLETGRVVHEGSGQKLLDNPQVQAAYLGI